MNRSLRRFALLGALALVGIGAANSESIGSAARVWLAPRPALPPLAPKSATAAQILAGAKAQIGDSYDASYRVIAYPMGDVKPGRGACTDVVIRALRVAGYDLQKRVHDDMSARWGAYPKSWGLEAPNSNIDHRRVPNQMVYLRKYGRELSRQTTGRALQSWQPGDIVYWNTGHADNTTLHTGIISDNRNADGLPLVIHNGSLCIEEDALDRWPIIGHFRFPA